jgi:hypothetical protein
MAVGIEKIRLPFASWHERKIQGSQDIIGWFLAISVFNESSSF